MLMIVPDGKLYLSAIPPPTMLLDEMMTRGGAAVGIVPVKAEMVIVDPPTNVEPTMLIVHTGIVGSIVVRSKTRERVTT